MTFDDSWLLATIVQKEQKLCFLKALQNIHVGQPRITFPSPFVG